MIKYINKDITTVTRGIVAHGVNCQGVMGSGVALAIRSKWPTAFFVYKKFCEIFQGPTGGKLGMVQTVPMHDSEVIVANCFTQDSFGHDGAVYANKIALDEALENVVAYAQHKNMPLYLPRIGCGLGGLSWDDDVKPILDRICANMEDDEREINIFVCDI